MLLYALSLLQVRIIKMVVPDSWTAVTEIPFLESESLIADSVWTLCRFHEEWKWARLEGFLLDRQLSPRL